MLVLRVFSFHLPKSAFGISTDALCSVVANVLYVTTLSSQMCVWPFPNMSEKRSPFLVLDKSDVIDKRIAVISDLLQTRHHHRPTKDTKILSLNKNYFS